MKKNILLFIFAIVSSSLIAQITVTNATFPAPGDTLRTVIDAEPNINLQDPGEDLTWNFSFLDGPVFENIILDPDQGANFATFPNATFMTGQTPLAERYFQTTTTTYTSLGYSGQDPIGLGLDVAFMNTPPLVERISPLNYDDDNNSSSFVSVPFAWSDLPAMFTDSLPLPTTPDSIAIEVTTTRTETVDAWGKVILPVGTYDVLRVRRLDITETSVQALVPTLPGFPAIWVDVTGFLGGISPLLGGDTTLTYRYYNDESKEPIAIITADPITDAPTNAQYKSTDPNTVGIIKLYDQKPNIYAYPNPAIDQVRFDVINIPNGKYDLNIYNILGVKVWSNNYDFNNSVDTIQLDINNFKKGTYLYSLVNEKGKTLATRRLVILRP
ncbi:MAG: T9SS type A sorting domain-containing protein [Saprospiraceae bacterium]|jgi:hypothetical protein|nr:T9SS type A sorting domain-containing protein [Saprospiraceae bacterium]MDG2417615.1 T9SS type A sorting domain-containing protein [Saprospiraceae bacterium]